MTNLVLELDVGNSAIKWRHIGDAGKLAGGRLVGARIDESLLSGVTELRIASVASAERERQLRNEGVAAGLQPRFARTQSRCGKVVNSYRQPNLMGVDRWLAMVAAYDLVGRACAVVDLGTALTVDLLDSQGRHQGGYITPGIEMLAASLLQGTDRVRFASEEVRSLDPGCSTAECVHHGKWLTVLGTVQAALAVSRARVGDDCAVVVTGGAMPALKKLAGVAAENWLYREDLVLDGLLPVLAADV